MPMDCCKMLENDHYGTTFIDDLSRFNQILDRTQYKGCPHCDEFSSPGLFTATPVRLAGPTGLKLLCLKHDKTSPQNIVYQGLGSDMRNN